MTLCQACDKTMPDAAAFCPHCGTAVETVSTTDIVAPVPPSVEGSAPADAPCVFPRANIGMRLVAGFIDVGIALAMILPLSRLAQFTFQVGLSLIQWPVLYAAICGWGRLRSRVGSVQGFSGHQGVAVKNVSSSSGH